MGISVATGIARWCVRHPGHTVAAWLASMAIAVIAGSRTGLRTVRGGLPDHLLGTSDLWRILGLGAPVVMLLLLFMLRSSLLAAAAILFIGVVLCASLGVLATLSARVPVSHLAAGVVPLLAVAVSGNHLLFSVARQREAAAAGYTGPDAAQVVAATAGRTALVSGFAVVVSMTGLAMVGDPLLAPVAIGAAVVAGTATGAALSLLPALLALLRVSPRRPPGLPLPSWPAPAERTPRSLPVLLLVHPVLGGLVAAGMLRVTTSSCGRGPVCLAQPSTKTVLSLIVLLALTTLVLWIAFRPAFVALATTLLGILSLTISVGLLAPEGWGVPAWTPLVPLVVLSGPATDFHVFLLDRFRSEALTGMSPCNATASGVRRCKNAIGGSLVVTCGACLAYGVAGTGSLQTLGWSTAAVLTVDAVFVRLLVLPALMSVRGRLDWYQPR